MDITINVSISILNNNNYQLFQLIAHAYRNRHVIITHQIKM